MAKAMAGLSYSARRRSLLTQAELAARAGGRTATACKAESDPGGMRLLTLSRILDALGLALTVRPDPGRRP